MEDINNGMNNMNFFLVGLLSLIVIMVLMVIVVNTFGNLPGGESPLSQSETVLLNNGTNVNLISNALTLTANVKNRTWLDFDGVNDNVTVNIPFSKSTISIWFKNATTNWTNIIVAGTDKYINNSLDNTWNFIPYYLSGDNVILGMSDSSTFLNVSLDEVRTYEVILNSSQISEVYNEGR